MKFHTFTAIFGLASLAIAAPAPSSEPCDCEEPPKEPTVGPEGNAVCGNGQVISCCNTNSVSNGSDSLLGIGGILDGLLGGSCSPLDIPILAITIPITKACGNNQAACCTGDQSGLVNLQCTNVNVL
ncbi:hypothetical protein OIDMADRAFT_178387 [Oidiodendron maius Zn]|uniref:Hydrophobin n=1 Tax=Oidiodendron maius (strain Zn) TaxID=913774 RepID=A0A0C3DQM4_OIDMZ|nr:hypothetical protein OIDMADRAFT_178387 [Oidiodendron maius Zn]